MSEAGTSTEQLVRDAMLPDPHPLDGGASAQEAGEALTRPEVRAVLVCDDGRFVGVITRKTLVREVVATGRDPRTTTLREIAEQPNATIDSATPLAEAFAFLEEHDFERVPVVENGRLVGVLSRSVVQRRLGYLPDFGLPGITPRGDDLANERLAGDHAHEAAVVADEHRTHLGPRQHLPRFLRRGTAVERVRVGQHGIPDELLGRGLGHG